MATAMRVPTLSCIAGKFRLLFTLKLLGLELEQLVAQAPEQLRIEQLSNRKNSIAVYFLLFHCSKLKKRLMTQAPGAIEK
jgi:hypothetical protein